MSDTYERCPATDALVRDDAALVLLDDQLIRLGPVGTALWQRLESPATADDCAVHLEERFGAPDGEDSLDLTRAAIEAMIAQRIVRRTDG